MKVRITQDSIYEVNGKSYILLINEKNRHQGMFLFESLEVYNMKWEPIEDDMVNMKVFEYYHQRKRNKKKIKKLDESKTNIYYKKHFEDKIFRLTDLGYTIDDIRIQFYVLVKNITNPLIQKDKSIKGYISELLKDRMTYKELTQYLDNLIKAKTYLIEEENKNYECIA